VRDILPIKNSFKSGILSNSVSAIVSRYRQPGYYPTPKFHASFAWALLDKSTSTDGLASKSETEIDTQYSESGPFLNRASCTPIPSFPVDLVDKLEEKFGEKLRRIGKVDFDRICVKIGSKDISSFAFGDLH
jgi:hypothetical protein